MVAELMAYTGYDFVIIDMEHGPGDYTTTLSMLQAVQGKGTSAIVRVSSNDEVVLKKVLDMGPDGVLIPMVNNAAEAHSAAAACLYPPRGVRGVAYPLVRASKWGFNPDYKDSYTKDLLVLIQVETSEAVAEVSDMARVKGIDGIFIGPLDLSASLGHLGDIGHPEVLRCIDGVKKRTLAEGALIGGFAPAGSAVEAMMCAGDYTLVAGAVDVGLLRDAAIADIARFKFQANRTPLSEVEK